jgi:UDP-N-acetylmuramoyl-tripeptide--D-alanyl-D-alanine ligase
MLTNRVSFSYFELFRIFGQDNCQNISASNLKFGICIDTRILKVEDMFIALLGENQDAHNRIDEAFSKGASLCVVNRSWYNENKEKYKDASLIIVEDTLEAFGKLANYYRNKFDIPVIAIGGANGKTTTKEITAHLLSQKFKVLKTFENFNNQLGVPLMLFQLDEQIEVAILEIGTNEPGEIYKLSNIIEPTMGLITNIGKEHLEKLIDIDGVEQEETHLFGYLAKNDALCLINEDDERLKKYKVVTPKYLNFGTSKNASFRVEFELSDELNPIVIFKGENGDKKAYMKTNGFTTALNAIAASSIAYAMNLTIDEIIAGLESFENQLGHQYARMLLEKVNGIKIFNDCYNANPESMKAALNTLSMIKCESKRIAVIADMRELGEATETEHITLLKYALENSDLVITYGEEFLKAGNNIEIKSENKLFQFLEQVPLTEKLKDLLLLGDTVLVKGSRSMKMENIVEFIKRNINI